MRLWPPTMTNGDLSNSMNGNDVPNTEGSNMNVAQALQDTMSGLLGGGPSADQGGSGGGMSGGAGSSSQAPGPGPNGGGGAGGGSSGGADGGQGTPGGRTTRGACGKHTTTPAPDRDDGLLRAPIVDWISFGGNAGDNSTHTTTMPATDNSTCEGGHDKDVPALLGCPPCDGKQLQQKISENFGG